MGRVIAAARGLEIAIIEGGGGQHPKRLIMVFIEGVKYACQRCIRGHRASGCKHIDSELFMIKPKGRPAIWCGHCNRNRRSRKSTTGEKPKHLNRNGSAMCNCSAPEKFPPARFRSAVEHDAITPSKPGTTERSDIVEDQLDEDSLSDSEDKKDLESPIAEQREPKELGRDLAMQFISYAAEPGAYNSAQYNVENERLLTEQPLVRLFRTETHGFGMVKPSFANISGGGGLMQIPKAPLTPPNSCDFLEEAEDISAIMPNMSELYHRNIY